MARKAKPEPIEAEIIEETIEQPQVEEFIKCAIVIGVKDNGGIFVETHGTEQNLVTLDGLLDYGKRYISQEYDKKEAEKKASEQ